MNSQPKRRMPRRAVFASLALIPTFILVAPIFAPYDPMTTDTARQLQPPNAAHLLGTDLFGRDVLSRVLHGGQRTLVIAALATLFAFVPGSLLGLVMASVSRVLTAILSGVINALLAFPPLLLALIVLTLVGGGALPLALATGCAQIAVVARVTYGAIVAARSAPHVEAARSLGASEQRVLLRHIAPAAVPTLTAYFGVVFSYSLLNNAALSFLGLGGQPGIPDWGVMLYEGRQAFRAAPWIGLAPGLLITLIVIGVQRAADAFARLD